MMSETLPSTSDVEEHQQQNAEMGQQSVSKKDEGTLSIESNTRGEEEEEDDEDNGEREEKDLQVQQQGRGRCCTRRNCCCFGFCVVLIVVIIVASLYAVARNNNEASSVATLDEYLEILDSFQITNASSSDDIQMAMDSMLSLYEERNTKCMGGSVVGISRNNVEGGTTQQRIYSSQGTQKKESHNLFINENTLFEIGSISKPLTGLVLAYQIESGYIPVLDTPVNNVLPSSIPDLIVNSNNDLMTFQHLVTHTSGLPRLAPVTVSRRYDPATENPYAGHSEQDLLDQIKVIVQDGLIRQTEDYEYSNFGFSFLAYLLGKSDGKHRQFIDIQQELTYEVLNMTSTFIGNSLSSTNYDDSTGTSLLQRLSTGYSPHYPKEEMPYWYDGGIFIDGAGSTVSSASDLLSLSEKYMMFTNRSEDGSDNEGDDGGADDETHTLKLAIERSLEPLKPVDEGGVAYGWFYGNALGSTVYAHSGGTEGFSSYVGFNPSHQFGVVGLSNCGYTRDVDLMGVALLRTMI